VPAERLPLDAVCGAAAGDLDDGTVEPAAPDQHAGNADRRNGLFRAARHVFVGAGPDDAAGGQPELRGLGGCGGRRSDTQAEAGGDKTTERTENERPHWLLLRRREMATRTGHQEHNAAAAHLVSTSAVGCVDDPVTVSIEGRSDLCTSRDLVVSRCLRLAYLFDHGAQDDVAGYLVSVKS
jgi:hypothetical protein